MGNTLFSLVDDMQSLYEMGTDPDLDPQVLTDTLESVMGSIEVKASGYVNVIKQLEMEQKQAEVVSQEFQKKARVRENAIKRMKEALKVAMERLDTKELDAGDFKIKLQKNGGKQPLVLDGDVPENMCKVILEPDKDRIRAFLEGLEESDVCAWAHLEQRGEHIAIK